MFSSLSLCTRYCVSACVHHYQCFYYRGYYYFHYHYLTIIITDIVIIMSFAVTILALSITVKDKSFNIFVIQYFSCHCFFYMLLTALPSHYSLHKQVAFKLITTAFHPMYKYKNPLHFRHIMISQTYTAMQQFHAA